MRLLEERIRRDPPRTQREGIRLGVRQSIATHGPMPLEYVGAAVKGIVQGLFGEAYDAADEEQRARWLAVCDEEYRRAIGMADDDTI